MIRHMSFALRVSPRTQAREERALISRAVWARVLSLMLVVGLSSCALEGVVQRQTVEYNTAAAGMADQLTLLNIVRAKEDLPIFYTSISRLSGSAVVMASAGFNGQLKTQSPTDMSSTTTGVPDTVTKSVTTTTGTMTGSSTSTAAGATSTGTTAGSSTSLANAVSTVTGPTVTNLMSHAVTSGGDIYMPSVGGQIMGGPSFDINILDTQLFYQGILAEIPFSTIDNYIDQGYDNQLLLWLLVDRIEFRLSKPVDGFPQEVGSIVKVLYNRVSEHDKRSFRAQWEGQDHEADVFANEVACLALSGRKAAPKTLVPLSRLTTGKDADGKPIGLRLADLALLDGQKFDIDRAISDKPADDDKVSITRPPTDKREAKLERLETCPKPISLAGTPGDVQEVQSKELPKTPPPDAIYIQAGQVIASVKRRVKRDDKEEEIGYPVELPVDVFVTFRSAEGVIRFLGKYLSASETNPDHTYRVGKEPLFSVESGRGQALVTAEVLGRRYFVPLDETTRHRNMMVIALVEQLVDLQKSATDRPVTVPVHAVP
jgi:hypothetical protein